MKGKALTVIRYNRSLTVAPSVRGGLWIQIQQTKPPFDTLAFSLTRSMVNQLRSVVARREREKGGSK